MVQSAHQRSVCYTRDRLLNVDYGKEIKEAYLAGHKAGCEDTSRHVLILIEALQFYAKSGGITAERAINQWKEFFPRVDIEKKQNQGFKCVICGIKPVNPEDGEDTCWDCLSVNTF